MTPASGTTAATATVSVNLGTLSPGTYTGEVSFSSTGADNWNVSVPVVLVVNSSSAASGSLSLISLKHLPKNFEIPLGVTLPIEVQVSDSSGQPVTGAAVTVGFSSGESLTLIESGNGNYGGRWTPPAAGPLGILVLARKGSNTASASTSGTVISVGADPPMIFATGVVNAASFLPAPAPLVPGSIVSVFGRRLAGLVQSSTQFPLPTAIGGTNAFFDEIAAPIFFASPEQMNLQVPYELDGRDRAILRISRDGVLALSLDVRLARFAPAIFSATGTGRGQGAILISDTGGVVAAPRGSIPGRAARPARRQEVVSIYTTGLGPVDPKVATGAPGPATPSFTVSLPQVTIGGIPAPVTFSGLAPGFAGLYQINVQVPVEAPSGSAVPLVLRMGNLVSDRTTIAVE